MIRSWKVKVEGSNPSSNQGFSALLFRNLRSRLLVSPSSGSNIVFMRKMHTLCYMWQICLGQINILKKLLVLVAQDTTVASSLMKEGEATKSQNCCFAEKMDRFTSLAGLLCFQRNEAA